MIDLKVNFKKKDGMDLRCPFCNDWEGYIFYIFIFFNCFLLQKMIK